jgi:hypothetical protein
MALFAWLFGRTANPIEQYPPDRADYLVDRHSERKEAAAALMKRVNLSVAA